MRKDRDCSTWWYAACVLEGSDPDKVSVPCAMFERCMYAATRDELPDAILEVMDAWAHKTVCLIGYSPAHTPDLNPARVHGPKL